MKITQKEIDRANENGLVVISRPWKEGEYKFKVSLVDVTKQVVLDSMLVEDKSQISYESADLLRWQDKCGNSTKYTQSSRHRKSKESS